LNLKNKKALTIAVLGSLPPLRALSSYCLEFSRAMAELVEIDFISFKKIYPAFLYPGGGLKDDPTLPVLNHDRVAVKCRLTWYNPATWLREGFFSKAALLHAQWWSLPLFPIFWFICIGFKLRGKPVVFTVHNVLSHEKSSLFGAFSKLLFKLGDHFIVHSGKNRMQMIQQYNIPEEHITIIPHGPLDFHTLTKVNRETARRKMKIHPEEKVILLFGAIRPYKGIDTAISAFDQVLKEIPEARLLIAGKLWEKWNFYAELIENRNLKKYIHTFLHYIPSEMVANFFNAADLVILPYDHFNSQSGVGSIAVSFRKPMIVTNTGGLPDLVENPRSIVPPKDPDALARGIISSLNTPGRLKEMETEAEIVAKRIAWPALAKRTLAIYIKILGQ
jgi:glycosyltransferase involved in cell wall biosynthesis